MSEYNAYCIDHKLKLNPDHSCPECKDANGRSFPLDIQSYYLVKLKNFRQIRSSFNDPDDKMFSCRFETMKDLLHHDYVRRHTVYRHFFRFSIIPRDNTLMAEFTDGFEWWVVGKIDDPSGLDLPEWKAKYYAMLDGEEVILVDEVISSCGDELTLRDGRKARNLHLRTVLPNTSGSNLRG